MDNEYTLKNEGQECKTGPVGVKPVGERRVISEGEGSWTWAIYFIYLCESKTVKPAEIVVSGGEEGLWESDDKGEPDQSML
jgi:hypothetical protein